MKISVNLSQCQDHGQCVFSAPKVFSLNAEGKLSFRSETNDGVYLSGELDESFRDDVEEAADVCPLQAITVHQ